MTTKETTKITTQKTTKITGVESHWDLAIADAKAELQTVLRRGNVLRGAIKILTKKRDGGEPWPGQS